MQMMASIFMDELKMVLLVISPTVSAVGQKTTFRTGFVLSAANVAR
jgi:hypothetical protein